MNVHPKVVGSVSGTALGGAIVTVLAWFLSFRGINLPDEVIAALTVIVSAVLGFVGGYLSPQSTAPQGQKDPS